MKYFIAGILLVTSQAAWSFGGFGNFQKMLQTIECVRKPGTDYLVCGPKTQDEEEAEEIEPQDPIVEPSPDLFPQEQINALRTHNPEMDYVWSDGTKFVIDLVIVEDNLKFGEQCDRIHQEIFPEDINFDDHQDFMIQFECQIDELYQGKSIREYWGGGYIPEMFIIFACGSNEGLYNCTEEFTGHKDVLAMAPDAWPGAYTRGEPAKLHDVNGDGIRDIFMWTNNDVPGRAQMWRDDIDGTQPFFDRYYDLWGKPYESCNYFHPNANIYTCWFARSVQTYAISTPNGHVVKELEFPGQFIGVHGWEMYKTGPDELHVNFDAFFTGAGTWYTWNPQTEEFDFVVSHLDGQENLEKYRPVDITKDWITADTFDRGGASNGLTGQLGWITHNDVEYKVQTRDFSKTVFNYGDSDTHAQCESITDFDYDICSKDQIYIVSKTDQGIETFIEYRPQEIATEVGTTISKPSVQDPGHVNDQEYVAMYLHGYWLVRPIINSVYGKLVQLEDRPDADWYLVVTYMLHTDMWAPGEHYVPSFISEELDECRPNVECLYNESEIAFKYRVDFENQDLVYEGTLFEYPFIWRSVQAENYMFRDANGDGWKDVSIKYGDLNLWHVSNIYGELNLLDLETVMPSKFVNKVSDIWMDVDGDGNDDLMRLENRGEYHAEVTNIVVNFTAENLWDVTPILTPWDIKERFSPENCLVKPSDRKPGYSVIKGSGRPSECYLTNR